MILVIEDTEEYQKIILRALGDHDVVCVPTVDEGLRRIHAEPFEMVVVDINLPDKDGYFLLGEVRSNPSYAELPILCLTGRSSITDKVTAFSLGADDYLTKPFHPIELKARVEVKLKLSQRKRATEQKTTVGEIEIDHSRHRVMVRKPSGSHEVELTQTEFKILTCLARRPEQVYTRDQILVAASGTDAAVLDRVVDSHICVLRRKLGPHGRCIRSVTGVGYKIVRSLAEVEVHP